MSSCDDLFQERQRMLLEQQETDAQLARFTKLRMSNDIPDDEFFRRAANDAADNIGDPANAQAVDDGIADPKAAESQVSIPEGQPVNYKQQLRTNPEEVVRDYATLTRALMQTGRKLMPDEWKFMGKGVKDAADLIAQEVGSGMTADQVLRHLSAADDPFKDAVERTVRLRWWHDTAKKSYLEVVGEIGDFMDANPNVMVDPALARRSFDNFKVALMAERHYDHVRNTWSRMGQAMQGKNFDDTMLLADDDVLAARRDLSDPSPEDVPLEEAIALQPGDLAEDQSIARVFNAIDMNRTDPIEAMKQLELEINSIRITGTDPRKRVPKNLREANFKLANLLAKDSQLFNERTQGLNLGSNLGMALYGPYRKMWENMLYRPVGTKFMDHAMDTWQAQWAGYGAAVDAVRASGKEVFMDAWRGDAAFYSSNIETYGKFHQPVEERISELEAAMNKPAVNFLSHVNPERYRLRMHAAVRLWLYDKTGIPAALRPGLTAMGAVDNLAGFAFHHFDYRNQLEMKARRDGMQLGLVQRRGDNTLGGSDLQLDRRAMHDWINEKYEEGFYGLQPTEAQVKAYRKEKGISPDVAPDSEVAAEILEERVRSTYGAPAPINPEAKAASEFSEQMRFQNKPGDGNLGQGVYNAINSFRRGNYVADMVIPYLQSPFMGTSLDFTGTGIGGGLDLIRHLTGNRKLSPQEMRRTKANLIIAGHLYATYAGLSASGNIVGNGPVDPKEKAEWRAELAAQGKRPNSIAGVQLLGGVPLISTLFLMEDLRHNIDRSMISKHDQTNLANAALSVLAGHLTRTTALGNVAQLFDILYGEKSPWNQVGFMGAGQIPGIGVIRSGERVMNTQSNQLYRNRPWTKAEDDLFDPGVLESLDRTLREAAYGVSGGFGLLGGNYKDKDWLGTQIRLPWGYGAARYVAHRFFPHLHPEDKVYAELNMLNMLEPPAALMTRTLVGVPMSDDLQKEYNDTYGSIKGELAPVARLKMAGATPNYRIKLPIAIDLPSGMRLRADKTLVNLDLSIFLGKHTKGKTFLQAARSLMNDPIYMGMQAAPSTTSDPGVRDKSRGALRTGPASRMMGALKLYYGYLTEDALGASQSPAAEQWRERRDMVLDAERKGEFERMDSFQGVMGGAQ